MAKEPDIGAPIPKGVIDTAHENVGVEEQRPMSVIKQLRLLRAEVKVLRQRVGALESAEPAISTSEASISLPFRFACIATATLAAVILAARPARLRVPAYGLLTHAILNGITGRSHSNPSKAGRRVTQWNKMPMTWFNR